jgi:hypothetical protein
MLNAMVCGLSLGACGGDAREVLTRRSGFVPPPSSAVPDDGMNDAGVAPPPRSDPPDEDPPPFEAPGCPSVPTPAPMNECDPLSEISDCPTGESCFPFVDYPSGPCEIERYGTLCLPSGPGTQGDSCSDQACAADHICVSTGRGTQCARLCGLASSAPDVCAPGLLCLPIDIEGFGGCL